MGYKDLLHNRFTLKYKCIDNYGNKVTEKRYFYGPYLYIVKWNNYYTLYSYYDGDKQQLKVFDNKVDILEVISICKEWYGDLNSKLIREIENLESKRDEIMNYVF